MMIRPPKDIESLSLSSNSIVIWRRLVTDWLNTHGVDPNATLRDGMFFDGAEFALDRRVNWVGTYASGTTYEVDDMSIEAGYLAICNTQTTDSIAPVVVGDILNPVSGATLTSDTQTLLVEVGNIFTLAVPVAISEVTVNIAVDNVGLTHTVVAAINGVVVSSLTMLATSSGDKIIPIETFVAFAGDVIQISMRVTNDEGNERIDWYSDEDYWLTYSNSMFSDVTGIKDSVGDDTAYGVSFTAIEITASSDWDRVNAPSGVASSMGGILGVDQTALLGDVEVLKSLNSTNGFDLQDPDSMGTLAWDNGTRTASIEVKSGQSAYKFYVNGTLITKTATESVIIPDTTGVYFTYFDSDGVLQYTEHGSFFNAMIFENALVHLVRWNATQGSGDCGSEQHGYRMDSSTHMYNHLTTGARYESGINITGLTDGDPNYTGTTAGYFWDEDIRHSVGAETTHPFLYRLGATGEWTTTAADNYVGYNGGSGDYKWNEWTGATWQLSAATPVTDYFMTFFVANPSIGTNQVFKIIGHTAYSSRNNAREAIETEVNNLVLEGLPGEEFVFLYAVIVRRNGDLEDLEDGSTYFDLRKYRGGAGGTSLPAETDEFIHLTKSTIQDIGGANANVTYVDWESELSTNDNFDHDNSTNPSRIEVVAAGRYELKAMISGTQGGSARTTLMTSYRIDGSTIVTRGRQRNYSRGSAYGDLSVGLNTEMDLTAGQYIELGITVDDTDAAYTINTVNAECELIMRKIG